VLVDDSLEYYSPFCLLMFDTVSLLVPFVIDELAGFGRVFAMERRFRQKQAYLSVFAAITSLTLSEGVGFENATAWVRITRERMRVATAATQGVESVRRLYPLAPLLSPQTCRPFWSDSGRRTSIKSFFYTPMPGTMAGLLVYALSPRL
jgi:hypothetical protein